MCDDKMIYDTSKKWTAVMAFGGILIIIGALAGLIGGLMFVGFIMMITGLIQMIRHGGRSIRYRPAD
jgi:predicted benzoate:H+ symporter BenE